MRTRLVGLSVVSAVVAIVLFGVPLAAIVGKYLVDDERGELERIADLAAVWSSVDLAHGQLPHELPISKDSRSIAVYDASGRRIIGQGPSVVGRVASKAVARARIVRSTDEGGDIVVAVPVAAGGPVLGVVRAATPRAQTVEQITLAWGVMVVLAAVALVVVWLLARRMAARLAHPLEHLAKTAHALGDGDFSVWFAGAGVAEIDSVAEALNSTATRLSDLVFRERAFSADASHQLRTPLTALRLGLEVALDDCGHDPREAIATAIKGTDRLQATVEDLLALARDSDRPRVPLALEGLLDELARAWGPQLAARNRALTITLPPRSPVSGASAAAVRQILAVLVDNAFTHGAGTVTVAVRDAGGALAIDVTDQGPGITVASAALFVRRTPCASGHGIGLALARRLAEAEGARLRLSRPAPPTFTLLLPALDRGDHRPRDGAGQGELAASV